MKDRILRAKAAEYAKTLKKEGVMVQVRVGRVIVDGTHQVWNEGVEKCIERKN